MDILSSLRKRLDAYYKRKGLKIKAVAAKALDEYLKQRRHKIRRFKRIALIQALSTALDAFWLGDQRASRRTSRHSPSPKPTYS
ncbi:hypothetical protein DRN63_04960 [Nanoarchaeota archaeon]|nr:MAG: hypothetical protein DRN63_04960 [Nanoarchaeota archaeon]